MPRFELKSSQGGRRAACEVELDGLELTTWHEQFGHGKRRSRTLPNQELADDAFAAELRRLYRRGYSEVGASRVLGSSERDASALLIDLYFSGEDERFVEELVRFTGQKKLAELAEPWFRDQRPFARRALLAYVDDGCDRHGHKALVKRLFKLAEANRDDELMARFLVTFDRFCRRLMVAVDWEWNEELRESVPLYALRADPGLKERLEQDQKSLRFTRATRRYLMRRAFRYFRRIGYRDAEHYRRALLPALLRYRDEDLCTPARFLSAWGLLHALYGRSLVLKRVPFGVMLAPGRTLAELTPAPLFPRAWHAQLGPLLELVSGAAARPVRAWALALLRSSARAELDSLSLERIKLLLFADNDEARLLGMELLSAARDLEKLSVEDWLELLGARDLDVLAAVCGSAERHVSHRQLTLRQCVDLAISAAAPLAALGLLWAKGQRAEDDAALLELLRLTKAQVPAVRADGARHLAELLLSAPTVRAEYVRELVDSAHVEVRAEGLRCLAARFAEDAELWFALSESPYPDVMQFIAEHARRFHDVGSAQRLHGMFARVMLAFSGRAVDKRRVAQDIAARLAERPEEAARLLPLLGTTLRSIHPAERAVALGTLARAAVRHDALRAAIQSRFPELQLGVGVSE